MPYTHANELDLHYDTTSHGEPLVLVHGSWSDQRNWQAVTPALAESFRVVAYDRRGNSRSERPPLGGSREDQEDDLAALIEALRCAPAHVVGTSFGASIALGLAARRPHLFRSVIAHEPPLRETAVNNAPAVVDEQADSAWAHIEPVALARLSMPVLLTQGPESPAWFSTIIAEVKDFLTRTPQPAAAG